MHHANNVHTRLSATGGQGAHPTARAQMAQSGPSRRPQLAEMGLVRGSARATCRAGIPVEGRLGLLRTSDKLRHSPLPPSSGPGRAASQVSGASSAGEAGAAWDLTCS